MPGLTIPPSLIPYLTGVKKDYSTLQPQIVIVNGVFLALVLITAGARFWVRFRLLSSAGLDDSKCKSRWTLCVLTLCSVNGNCHCILYIFINIMLCWRRFRLGKAHLESES
jgi:hypothetical protein